ncbi:DNA-processing protein DprA [Clostridium sp. CTA-7]
MNSDELWLILANISNEKKVSLIEKYGDETTIKKYKDEIKEFKKVKIDLNTDERINEFRNYINSFGIGYITIKSKEYPESLRYITDPPYVLFYKGNIDLLNKRLAAVIGARKCTQYGVEVAKIIGKELSENNITVVSGLASGIDSVAQRSAIEFRGKTIGVLGCGIDIVYPKSNKFLYEKVIKEGLLISEFLPRTPPMPYNFPRRNRIISGISEKLIVIEATKKSGSLITVDFALSIGKEIMAIPGPVLNGNSEGCNKLIRDGAKPFTEMDDLYDFFDINKEKDKKMEVNEYKISLLKVINDEPKHLDDIIKTVNVDRKVLFELLFEMQNRNEIICLPGNYYAKSL